ncbi:MAG: IS3 family transposase [Phycisphaerae bacterium]|nr:IS3 family transposase [Phycisphaerae bacterium]
MHATVDDNYGSVRVRNELVGRGIDVSRNAVARIMRKYSIRAAGAKRFRVMTMDSRHDHPIAPNILDREFAVEKINQVWLADITYVQTDEGFLYLAGVLDLCSRRIVGWSMTDHIRAELALDALKMAIKRRKPAEGLLHHSDCGVHMRAESIARSLRSRRSRRA